MEYTNFSQASDFRYSLGPRDVARPVQLVSAAAGFSGVYNRTKPLRSDGRELIDLDSACSVHGVRKR